MEYPSFENERTLSRLLVAATASSTGFVTRSSILHLHVRSIFELWLSECDDCLALIQPVDNFGAVCCCRSDLNSFQVHDTFFIDDKCLLMRAVIDNGRNRHSWYVTRRLAIDF